MASNFRGEVFKLCKLLQKNETAQKIGKMLHSMSVVIESKETGDMIHNPYGDLAYIAKSSNNEFHGFLFVDDNVGTLDVPKFLKPIRLTSEDRLLFEQGHKTLTRFISLCLSDVAKQSGAVADSMNPYFLYRPVKVSEDAESLLTDEELQPAVLAFKSGSAYKALMATNFTQLFKKIDINAMRALESLIEKEINQSLGEEVSKDLREFSIKLESELRDITDVMFAFSILMLAIKASLKLSCRLLYRAISGVDLFVLNNDNIINIEKRASTAVCQFYKVFSQDIHVDSTGSEMGSIILLDCDLPHESHIHEFGMLVSETLNLAGEFGQSAKYSFVSVDEEMIHIHPIVKDVIQVGLPIVKIH